MQYVDDTLIVHLVDLAQLVALNGILKTFAMSTGLNVNFHKSFMVPINVEESSWASLTDSLGCQLGTMLTYLGLPLGTTRPSVLDFMPILTRMEKHPMGITRMLTYVESLILVNSIYCAMSTFYMCTLKISGKALKQIDRYRSM